MSNALDLKPKSIRAILAVTLTTASIVLTAMQLPANDIHILTGSAIAYYFATGGIDGK